MSSTSNTTNYLKKTIVKNGSVMPILDALSTSGLTDEKGNTVTFTDPLPTYYVEKNGYAYSLQGLDKALVTLRIEKIPEGPKLIEEKQEKEPNALQSTTKITSKTKQAK